MPLPTATSTFGLGRRRWSSPQQCYQRCLRTVLVNYGILLCFYIVCNFGQGWEVGYLTGVHTQYKALLPKEITATVGVHIGLRSVNITLLGQHV